MISSSKDSKADEVKKQVDDAPPPTTMTVSSIVRKFLVTWIVFVVLLIGVALLVNIDWAKSYCQQALTKMFHRKVRIGHLTWSFGLNGLEVDTAKLAVYEPNGQPFLVAGNSEIGISILPLLNKQMVISHLNFDHPEIWAIRTSKTKWNFDDLLEFSHDIRYFQLQQGTVHLIDRIPKVEPAWTAVDLTEAKLKFVWPRKGKKTPFLVAFRLPKKGYTTSFDFNGIGSGELQNWQDNRYTFDAKVTQANPEDVMPFLRAISDRPLEATENGGKLEQLKGLFDFKIDGNGVLSKGITADVSAQAHKFSFDAPVLGLIQAPEATTQAKVRIDTKKLEWKDMVTRLANIELTSHGSLNDWSKRQSQYSANVDSEIKDLSAISKLVTKNGAQTNNYVDASKLSGTAQVAIRIVGPTNPQLTTDVRTNGVAVEDFISKLPKELTPVLCLMGLNKSSQVQGEIKLIPDERVDILKGIIPVAGGTVETEGSANLKTDQGRFSFHSKDLSLARAEQTLYKSKQAMTELSRLLYLAPKQRLVLGGAMDMDGIFETFAKGHNTSGTAIFKNAQFCLSDGTLSAKNMNGQLHWNNNLVTIDHLAGTIGDGTFKLSGTAKFHGNASVDLKIHSSHLALNQLNTLLKVLKVRIPLLTEHQLRGRVHDLVLNVSGPRSAPLIYFQTSPEDLCYQPHGMTRPLRATSGTITYDRDVLTLNEVGFVTHKDKVITSFAIQALSKQANVKDAIKVQSKGIDLADVDFYLASPIMPVPLKKLYTDFLKEWKISKVHGRVYGDAVCQLKGDKSRLDGVISLINVGSKVGDQLFPVEHVAGTLAASGEQLVVQDLTGTIRNTHFNLNGQIDKYQSTDPSWRSELIASIDSKELLELVPSLTDQFKKWKLTLSASGPLSLKAKVTGDKKGNNVVFAVASDAANQLTLCAPIGKLHQPLDEALKVDGSMTINSSGIDVGSTTVLIGDSVLRGNGSVKWAYKDDAKTELDLSHSTLQASIKSPNPVPARKLVAVVDPTISKDVGGTVAGNLTLNGTIAHPKSSGKIEVNRLSLPKFDVRDLTGSINLEEGAGADQKAAIDFSQVQVGQIPIHKIKAEIKLDADEQEIKQPKILISNGRANLAGGALRIDGWLDLNDHKLSLHTTLAKARAVELTEQLGHPGELSGIVDADVKFETEGSDYKDALSNLSGGGQVVVHSGTVTRFGHLQAKLTQANLLHQGLFGFNLNNLLQSTVPVRTGQFKDLTSEFRLAKGILYIDELKYTGDDMRLWGAGKANLPLNTLDVEIAGKIPRVTSSMFGSGTLGEMSKAITLQKLMNKLTLHQLESLPSLPVLGDLASDKPRAFSFKVISPLDKPKVFGQSIEKSFHWLPSKPHASAHPLPGLAVSQR